MTCSELFVCINNNTNKQIATNVFNGRQYDWAKGTRPNTNLHERIIGARTEIAELSQTSLPITNYHLGLTISDGSYLELTINHALKLADVSALTPALVNEICSVTGSVNKFRVERIVREVDILQLNINIFELEVDVNAQFIQQETLSQKPADIQGALHQQQEVCDQNPTAPQSPIRQEIFNQIPGVPRSPIQHETFDQHPQSPIRHGNFDQHPTFPQSPIQQETFDQNPTVPQSPIQHENFDQNPSFSQSPIEHVTFDQNPTDPQSPIRHEVIDQNIVHPQSPIQKEIFDQTVVQTTTQNETVDQNPTKKVQMTWEEILENIISLTERFIQMEIIEECKNYAQFIVHFEDYEQISEESQQMLL